MTSKGFTTYKTKSDLVRFSSYIIINRKIVYLASHESAELAVIAHLKAKDLIKYLDIQEVKLKIRTETKRACNFTTPGRTNIFKHRNKYYFRFMEKGIKFHSHGYSTAQQAYSALIDERLKRSDSYV